MNQVETIVKELTLDEKIGFLTGKDFWYLPELSRLNLPSIMLTDGPHGLRKQVGESDHVGLNASAKSTCFPTASLLASTWDTVLLEQVGKALGNECKTEQVSVLLGPGANIKRHPLCGRNFEYFSEDPLLSGTLAAAFINGVQSQGIGTSLKHYVANNQETMRMVVDAIIDERTLRELYLKSFEIAVKEAQPWTVMCSYNLVNGVYLSEHTHLLQHVLKDEWQHEGLVVTDWGACNNRVAGIHAGQDLEMPSSGTTHKKQILKALQNGELEEHELDKRVSKVVELILKAKQTLEAEHTPYDPIEHHQFARHVATEGMVLLKNEEHILPLSSNVKIALIGEFAEKPRYQGSGSSLINPNQISTAYEAFQKTLQDQFLYAKGYSVDTDVVDQELLDEAIETAKQADIVVIMAGLTNAYESEGFDRTHLNLPTNHTVLIDSITEIHQKVIVVLSNGAPVLMPWKDKVQGIIEQYLAGQASGEALVDILFGTVNPSGKLAETFPNTISEIPANNHFPGSGRQVEYREGLYVGYRAYDSMNVEPLFPFGFGLSYTSFEYNHLQVQTLKDEILVKIDITNTGTVFGKEIVQVYVHKESDIVYRPQQELKAFAKIDVQPGETKTVEMKVSHHSLKVFQHNQFLLEAGIYLIKVGSSSRDIYYQEEIHIESMDVLSIKSPDEYFHITSDFAPTKEHFEELLGHGIPPYPPIKPYHFNSTILELRETFVGKQLFKVIQRNMVKIVGEEMDETSRKMIDTVVLEMPFRNLVVLSAGMISHRRAAGLLDLMNKKPINGLIKVIRG